MQKLLNKLRRGRLLRDQRGQGMTEYIIIVALVAIATIAVVTVFGDNVRGLFSLSADALGGKTQNLRPDQYNTQTSEQQRKKSLAGDLGGP